MKRKFNFPLMWTALSVVCGLMWTLMPAQISAQSTPSQTSNPAREDPRPKPSLLPDNIIDKWRAVGAARKLGLEQLQSDKLAEIYFEYGVEEISYRNYTNNAEKFEIKFFQMRFPSGAYGLLTFLTPTLLPNQQIFQAGRFLVQINAATLNKPLTPERIKDLASYFTGVHKAAYTVPPLAEHLPQSTNLSGNLSGKGTYFLGPKALARDKHFSFLASILNFTGGTEAVSAEYQQETNALRLLLIEFQTPQLASDGFSTIQSSLNSLDQNQKSFTNLSRIGNYLVVTTNATPEQANPIVSQIKYTAKVYWEGDKFTAIPLEFRPPDPVALQEASETAVILLRTFYWIGIMLLLAVTSGLVAGSCFFYWRRYQKRKLGLDTLFSDAGGAIQLQLDESGVESKEKERKLLR